MIFVTANSNELQKTCSKHLPPHNELESMLISGELPLKMNTPNDVEALLVQCERF
jgi:hypothetical protein